MRNLARLETAHDASGFDATYVDSYDVWEALLGRGALQRRSSESPNPDSLAPSKIHGIRLAIPHESI